MIAIDEDSLICDMAETYNILDYKSLPVRLVATLANGLTDQARIIQKIRGVKAPDNTILLAAIKDKLTEIQRFLYSDETPITYIAEGYYEENTEENVWQKTGFDSPEELFAAIDSITKG